MSDKTTKRDIQTGGTVPSQNEEKPSSVDKKDSVVINIENLGEQETSHGKVERIDVAYLTEGNKNNIANTGKEYVVYEVLTRHCNRLSQGKRYQSKLRNRTVEDEELADGRPLDYDPSSRNGFVLKVMVIVLVMLVATAAVVVTLINTPRWGYWFEIPFGAIWLLGAMALDLAISYAIGCCTCSSRPPVIYVLLPLSWLAMTIICVVICMITHTHIVFYALLATVVCVIVCIMLACTQYDFTKWMLYVIVISIVLCALSIILVVAQKVTRTHMPIAHIILLFGGTIVNVIFLIIELQMVLGGKSIELNEDEYCLAAYMIYNSIVEIFIALVQLLSYFVD